MANTWVVESAGTDDEMNSTTLGNLTASKIRVVSTNVTWDTTGYLWSQANSSSSIREFGLFMSAVEYLVVAGGDTNSMGVTSATDNPIVNDTVDLTVDFVANTAILKIGATTVFSGAITAGTDRFNGEPFRLFARGGGYFAADGTRIGNTEVYIDDVLVRNYDFDNSSHGTGIVTVDETLGSDDFTGVNMATDGSPWVDLGSGSGSITLLNPKFTHKITAGNITVPVTGSYTGTPTTIRARVVFSISGLPVSGLDWFTLDATPSGGVFSGNVDIPESNLAYKLEVDFSNDALITDESTEFWSAIHLLIDGQSLGLFMSEEGTTLTPHANTRGFDGANYFVPIIGDGTIQLMNNIRASLDRFVVVVNTSVGSRSVLKVNESSTDNYVWNPVSPLSNPLYTDIIDSITVLGGVDAHISIMGETDARLHVASPATFKTELDAFYNDIRTRTGLTSLLTVITPVGKRTDTFDDTEWEEVKQAQFEVANEDANNYHTAHFDLPLRDVVHLTNASNIILATRISNLILTNLYGKSLDWQLPLITTAQVLSTTETLISIQQGDGTDFTPTSGITGFEVSVDGIDFTPVISAAVRNDAATIKLTHAALSITNYRYMYGNQIDITGAVIDNSAINLPLFSKSGGVIVTSNLDVTITGIPDGSFMTVLDKGDGTRIQRQNETYASESSIISLAVPIGTTVKGYVDDNSNPSTDGAYIEGITE